MAEQVAYEISLNDLVTGKLDKAEQHAQKFESRLGSVYSTLGHLGQKIIQVGEYLGIYFAFEKIGEFVHESIEMQHQLEQSNAQVKAGLISTNYAAGVSFEDLETSAKKFAATLPFTQAQIVDMQSQIVTFPGITKKVFDTASQSIMDMSTRLHHGLNETAIMVGKALQDPAKGITAMRRVGVNFNEEQTKVIKNLVHTGHVAQAQALILKELQTEFAGSAKAAANSDPLFRYNKLMESLKYEVGEAGEKLISVLTPGLETVVGWVKTGYEGVKAFSSYLRDNMGPILKEIKNDVIAVGVAVGVAAIGWAIANPTVIIYTGALIANGIASAGLAVVTGVLTAAQWALNLALTANPVGIIVVAIGAFVGGLIIAYKHSEKFRAVLSGIGEIAKDIGGIFKGLGEMIWGALTFDVGAVKKGFTDMATSFKDVGSAFHRGYTESIAKSEAEEAKEKHQTTMGKQAEKKSKLPTPGTVGGKQSATSKVTGSKVLNINIHIGALVKELKIQTTNLKEGVGKAQDMVTNALLSAVNDSQMATDL